MIAHFDDMPAPGHYQPAPGPDGTWQFTTPTGKSDGFLSQMDAIKAAARTEQQDRHEAANGTGIIAAALLKYFAAAEGEP